MPQSYDRRINLYINIDGKEVKNNVASIRAEMTKIVNEQKRMTIGSQEYNASTQKIRQLNGILAKHSEEVRNVQKGWSMKGMAEGFNRYFAMVTAAAASLTGLVIGFKQVIQTFNDYEERVDNLSALTGLAGESLDWLSQKAKDLSTATLEGGIRVTQSAQDIIDAFTKTGSARPELLKNKEALVATTTEAIILANAAKTELYPAIEALTMVMNQYNLPATEARRIINLLAAGSKEGAGEIPYLTTAFEKAGTVAALAGISIETLGAAIETLAPRITQPEIAGRSLKGVLIDMQTGADDTNPAIVGLSTALENLGKKNLSVTELTKKFGTENIATIQILLTNIEELKRYEKAMTGTNVAIEQAAINTDNNNAKLAQAKNRLNVLSIELGEKLAPSLQISTNGLSYFIKGLTATIDFVGRNKAILVTLLSTIVAYTVATKLAAVWEARANKEKLISIVVGKLQAFWYNAQLAGVALYNTALALLRGNLALASVQFRAFSAAMMANPIGIIAASVVGLGVAIYMLSGKLTAAQKAQQTLNEVNLEAQKNIVEEKIKLGSLLDMARNEKLSKDERIAAIRQLNAISPEYLSGLTLETINTKTADDAVKAYTESLLQKARAQAALEKITEIDKQLLDLSSGKGGDVTFWQDAGNSLLSFGNATMTGARNAASEVKNLIEKEKELNLQKEKLLAITQKQAIADLNVNSANGANNSNNPITPSTTAKDTTNTFAVDAEEPIDMDWIKANTDAEAKAFAEKKRSQEEWTAFLDKKVQEQMDIKNKEFEFDKEIAAAQDELKSVRIDAIGQVAGALSSMFEQGSAAQIAFMAIEKAAAIAQIIFQTSIANAKAVAMSPLTFGQPWVTINTVSAGASIAAIIAQTVGQLVQNKKSGYATGGYTGPGGIYEPAGIVHAGEWVASAAMVNDPFFGQIIAGLEAQRRTRFAPSPGAVSSSFSPPFASGGFASRVASSPSTSSGDSTPVMGNNISNEQLEKLNRNLDRLMGWKPTLYTEQVKKDLGDLENIEKNRGL